MSYRREPRQSQAKKAARFPQSTTSQQAEITMREAMAAPIDFSSVLASVEPALPNHAVAPHVIVSLGDDGGLQLEIRGESQPRFVPLKLGKELETIHRVLQGQLARNIAIGLDGAPTQAQVRHWERHEIWPSASCPFCVAEGRVASGKKSSRSRAEFRGNGQVEVRTVPVAKGKRRLETRKSIEDLGL